MKKLILILASVFSTACLAQNPQMLPADPVGRWDAASRQCDSENSGIAGIFNSMFGKQPLPCIDKVLVAARAETQSWCPEEIAVQPDTTVTVWKNCRPAIVVRPAGIGERRQNGRYCPGLLVQSGQ